MLGTPGPSSSNNKPTESSSVNISNPPSHLSKADELEIPHYDDRSGSGKDLASIWAFETLPAGSFAILSLVSMLDSESVQEHLLLPTLETPSIIPEYPTSKPKYHKFCESLIQSSLVERSLEDGSLRTHRLVQKVTRATHARMGDLAQRAFEIAVSNVLRCWPITGRDYVFGTSGRIDRWDMCSKLLPHVSSLSLTFEELPKTVGLSCFTLVDLLCKAAGSVTVPVYSKIGLSC